MPAYLPQLAFQPYITPDTGGEPVKELSDLGTSLNSAYNTSIAQNDALDEHLAQLKATLSPADYGLLDQINQGTRADLADIKQNGNWENAQMPLRAAARRLLTNPGLIVAQQNATTRAKLDEINTQAQAQGHKLIQFQDYHNTPSVNQDGSFNKLNLNGVFDKQLDYQSKREQIFQGLNADSYSDKVSKPERDDTTGQIYQVGNGSSYRKINTKKIQNVVANNLDNYLGTDEGKQELRVLMTSNSENTTPLSYTEAKAQVAHNLLMTGYTHRFSDASNDSSQKLAPGKQQLPGGDGTVAVADTAVPINQDFSNIKDALVKKDRSVGSIIAALGTPTGGGNQYSDMLNVSKDMTPRYNNKVLESSPLYQSLASFYSKSLGTTDKDKINPLITKYLSGIENRTISPILHATSDPKQIKADNDFIQNGIVKLAPIYDPATGKTYSSMNDPSFKKDHSDIKEKDFGDAKLVGQYDQNHPYADVTGNDNFTTARKISVGGHDLVMGEVAQDKRSGRHLEDYLGNKITASDRFGTPVSFTNGTSKMKILSRGDGTYVVQGKDSRGQDLPLVPISLEQAKTFLGSSGYTEQR